MNRQRVDTRIAYRRLVIRWRRTQAADVLLKVFGALSASRREWPSRAYRAKAWRQATLWSVTTAGRDGWAAGVLSVARDSLPDLPRPILIWPAPAAMLHVRTPRPWGAMPRGHLALDFAALRSRPLPGPGQGLNDDGVVHADTPSSSSSASASVDRTQTIWNTRTEKPALAPHQLACQTATPSRTELGLTLSARLFEPNADHENAGPARGRHFSWALVKEVGGW